MQHKRCVTAVLPGETLCEQHAKLARWTIGSSDDSAAKRGGARTKQTPAKLARLHELRGEGKTIKEICAALDISDSTYYHWRRQAEGR
jgi:hypothetical protein